jgi:hypothetical protein
MTQHLAAIRDRLLQLPEQDRENLAFDLLDSLSEELGDLQDQDIWQSRLDDLKSGSIQGLSPDEYIHEVKPAFPENVKSVILAEQENARLVTPKTWDGWFRGPSVTEDFMQDREQPKDQKCT